MRTRSIDLTDDEANDLRHLLDATGEAEDATLKRAFARGLKDLQIEQAIRVFKESGSSSEAAEVAGMPRAHFLQLLIDEDIELLSGPSTLSEELEVLGERLGSQRLRAVARELNNGSS